MSARQQPRRTARELALLGLSQASGSDEKLAQQDLNTLMLEAVRTLVSDVREALETAGMEVRRGSDRLNKSEVRAPDVHSARVMVREGLALAEQAINRLGAALDLPEFINLANQQVVRDYAFELVGTIKRRRSEISAELERSLVDWSLSRLPQLDRQILMMAVAEMRYLDVPERVAINEAVELAKRYSDEEGARFINGVLRRVTNRKDAFAPVVTDLASPLDAEPIPTPAAAPDIAPDITSDIAPEVPATEPPAQDAAPESKEFRLIPRRDPQPPSTPKPILKPILNSLSQRGRSDAERSPEPPPAPPEPNADQWPDQPPTP